MSSERRFAKDDENDSLLFERWEAHVIETHPNPQRIGCPSHEILASFVDKPEGITLADLNDTHITRCRECTLELKELRSLREERLKKSASPPHRGYRMGWRSAAALAFCLVVVLAIAVWQRHRNALQSIAAANEVVALTIDLSGDGVSRSPAPESHSSLFGLPRKIVDLNLILPYFSPDGDYQITIARDKNDRMLETVHSRAVAQGARTQAQLRLDLRGLQPGCYYLGVLKTGEPATYFYPFTLN